MEDLPIELLDIIACTDVAVYHALVIACRRYWLSLTPERLSRIKELFGYKTILHPAAVHDVACITRYYKDVYHCIGAPAIESNSSVAWMRNGLLHRIGEPALIKASGYREWRVKGVLHRADGPAVEYSDGVSYEWYFDGKLHRDGGPAVYSRDSIEYRVNGVLDRKNGPAIFTQFSIEWWQDGERHREDGPAYVNENSRVVKWYSAGNRRRAVPAIKQGYFTSAEYIGLAVKIAKWRSKYC